MNFRNPCRKCLVKACCTIACNERIKYNKFCETVIPLVFLCISFTLVFLTILLFVTITKYWIICTGLVWSISIFLNRLLAFDLSDLDDLKDLITVSLLAPFILITLSLMCFHDEYCAKK